MPSSQCDPGGEAGLKKERNPGCLKPFPCCWWAGALPLYTPHPAPRWVSAAVGPLLRLRSGENGTVMLRGGEFILGSENELHCSEWSSCW